MSFEPITTSIRGEGISLEQWEDELCGCDCELECTINSNCSCLLGQNNYISSGTLLHSESVKPLLECHSQCSCSLLHSPCQNRVVQNGVKKQLEVFKTSEKGHGVRTNEIIKKGEFVCEYAGECIGEEEVNRRYNKYKNEDNYTLTIKEHSGEIINKYFIDPRIKGNVGRFLNHSCQPNCEVVIVRIGRMIPTIGLFANRNISIGEELCYDYGESSITDEYRKLCHCGASNCRKYLPMSATPIE